ANVVPSFTASPSYGTPSMMYSGLVPACIDPVPPYLYIDIAAGQSIGGLYEYPRHPAAQCGQHVGDGLLPDFLCRDAHDTTRVEPLSGLPVADDLHLVDGQRGVGGVFDLSDGLPGGSLTATVRLWSGY